MIARRLRILIVEDESLIAWQLEAIITASGHSLVGIAATASEACALVIATDPDLAFVDVSLADNSSGVDVAKFISTRPSTWVLFATADARGLPDDLYGAIGVVGKPFTRGGVASALDYIASHIDGIQDSMTQPKGLHLSPAYATRWA